MTVSRLSTGSIFNQGVAGVQRNLANTVRLQSLISSGKAITRPSDDPLGLTKLNRVSVEQSQDKQFVKNIDDGLSELNVTDQTLGSITDLLQRAQELGIRAANASNGPGELSSFKQELEGIKKQLVQLGNTQFSGTYIFGGFKTTTQPFVVTNDDVAYAGSVATEPFEREVEIAPSLKVPINLNGQSLLGSVAYTSGVPSSGSGPLFFVSQMINDLNAGDATGLRSRLDGLKTSTDEIIRQRGEIGVRTSRLELTKNRLEERNLSNEGEIAKLQEVDLAKTISDLNFQQNTYEASLSSLSKILSNSVLRYLG